MFRVYRLYKVFLSVVIAGFIGMLAGLGAYAYIMEFTEKTPELLQAAETFRDLDELSFIVTMIGMSGIIIIALYYEIRHSWQRWHRTHTPKERRI